MMPTPKLIMAFAAGALALAAAPAAKAGSTFYFNANQSYLSANDNPFGGNVKLENFEDGLLNISGVKANHGSVKGPGSKTDSVDDDGGPIDGKGKSGHSFNSGSSKSITFTFNEGSKGLPTMAGLVWTDGKHDSTVKFRAWDDNGDLIGKIKVKLGDLVRKGTTGEDRFFGLSSTKGISKIQIASNYSGFEIDHLAFSYGMGLSVVPLPAPLALGLAGLAGAGLWRRRIMRQRQAA
jgi:MYXO-CTERM domain-containing protein